MAQRIALFNHKGGVSKTTTTFIVDDSINFIEQIAEAIYDLLTT